MNRGAGSVALYYDAAAHPIWDLLTTTERLVRRSARESDSLRLIGLLVAVGLISLSLVGLWRRRILAS
jgi:hypothetical protein